MRKLIPPFSHPLIRVFDSCPPFQGAILPGYQLHMFFVSDLHAGGERVLDAGGQHEAPQCAAKGALSAWHGEGIV